MSTTETQTGMNVLAKMSAIFFFWKILNRPSVTVDGTKHKLKWGQNFVPVPAGTHTVTFHSNLWFFLPVGGKTVQITVGQGTPTEVVYTPTWWFIYIPGKVLVNGQ